MTDRVLDIYSKDVDETVEKILSEDPETLEQFAEDRKIQEELHNYRKNVVEKYADTGQDYLDEDSPVHSQKYCVLSFAEKKLDLLAEEETFDFIHFMMNQSAEDFMKLMGRDPVSGKSEVLTDIKTENRNPEEDYEKLWGDDLRNLDKKSWEKVEPKLNNKWEVLYFRILKAYGKFKENNSVYLKDRYSIVFGEKRVDRVVKVRGSYKTIDKCKSRIKELKIDDSYHKYFIGEVGRWGTFNPEAWTANNFETANEKMNEMIREKKVEQDKAKNAFNLRKELLLRQAKKNNEEVSKNPVEIEQTVKISKEKLVETITEEEYQEMLKDPSVKDFGLVTGSSKLKHGIEAPQGIHED